MATVSAESKQKYRTLQATKAGAPRLPVRLNEVLLQQMSTLRNERVQFDSYLPECCPQTCRRQGRSACRRRIQLSLLLYVCILLIDVAW